MLHRVSGTSFLLHCINLTPPLTLLFLLPSILLLLLYLLFHHLKLTLSFSCRRVLYTKLSYTRLQNYTIGASLMSVSVSVSVSVQWNSSLIKLGGQLDIVNFALSSVARSIGVSRYILVL